MAALRLSTHDVVRLNAAQEVLLSPLERADPIEWQLLANQTVRRLLEADHSVFSLPADAGPAVTTDDTDPTFPERFLSYCIGIERGENRFRDPYVEKAGRLRRACGTGAYHERMLCDAEETARSVAYQEIFIPAGLTQMIGLSIPLPVGEATQFFSFEEDGAEGRSERGLEILRLLVPAFEAGVRIHRRLIAQQAALASTLDRLGQALAIYSTGGVPLHQSDTFNELLAAESEAGRLQASAEALARALTACWNRRSKTVEQPEPMDARRHLRTRGAEYRLLGSYLPADLLGAEGVLVLVERLQPVLPSAAHLRSRFELTAREAEIALLLAEGLTDGAIAEHLVLSPHTARRYSERVLKKLGLHSRAAIALTLLREVRANGTLSDRQAP